MVWLDKFNIVGWCSVTISNAGYSIHE
jgi:hypothetical protein